MMEALLEFLTDNVCIIFFANGFAFFSMGLALALEAPRVSRSALSDSLVFLAGFGFAASVGNWIQMFYMGLAHTNPLAISPFGQSLKLVCFVLAGALLLEFGVRLAIVRDPRFWWAQIVIVALLLGYVVAMAILLPPAYRAGKDWVSLGEIWARYMLHAPALALASLALLFQRRDFIEIGLVAPARDALGAAAAFGLKFVVSGLVAVPILGLAGPAGSEWGAPFQLLRTLTTATIAYFIVRILRVFEMERRQQLDQAVQERFQAQEKALVAQKQTCDEIRQWNVSMAQTVHTISSAISQPTPLDTTMKIVLHNTIELAGLQTGAVFLLDEEKQVLRLVAHQGLPSWVISHVTEVRVGDGLAGWVAQNGDLLIIDDIAHDPRPFVPKGREAVRFYVGIPLKAGGRLLGVMNLSSMDEHELAPPQVALLTAAGHQLGVAIEDAQLHTQLRSMAVMEERIRLSRELHDNLAQVIGYLNLEIGAVKGFLESNQVSRALGELGDMEKIAGRAYEDVRDSISALRVRVSPGEDLKETLQDYITEFGQRTGIEMTVEMPHSTGPFLAPDTAIQVLRIIQEALTNVRRHAQATHAGVVFTVNDHRATITIRDDGRGFDVGGADSDGNQHLGLLTMRERAEGVGGSLWIDSQVGQGTRIELSLPLG